MPNLISKLAGEKNMIQTLILPKAKGTSESLSDTKRSRVLNLPLTASQRIKA